MLDNILFYFRAKFLESVKKECPQMKFVPVNLSDQTKLQEGEKTLNSLLKNNWRIRDTLDGNIGIIYVLTRYVKGDSP